MQPVFTARMYHKSMPLAGPLRENVREYIRRHGLLRAGDRVGVAVSGGADSVALLRLLLELRGDLGVVLQVLHFHHGIRGAEADADQQFVSALAAAHALEFHGAAGDSPAHAAAHALSLETAARDLRYAWFRELLARGAVSRVATAHTLDDQAETVLMRTLRGAGPRGMAGIYPQLVWKQASPPADPQLVWKQATSPADPAPAPHAGAVARFHTSMIRPLLEARRSALLEYLRACGQPWREDQTNLDTRHMRNRIRHELMPLLERDFNPQVAGALATQAEIARAEEEYWQQETARALPAVQLDAAALDPGLLLAQPLALRRRLVRAAAEAAALRLEFADVEEIHRLASARPGASWSLAHGWRAVRGPDQLRFEPIPARPTASGYEYRLPVPGEVAVAELGSVFRVSLVPPAAGGGEYNALLPGASLTELVVRNWRAGDRFRPAHTRSAKKVKTLLQERRVAAAERRLWPVVLSGGSIVWMRGFSPAQPAGAQPSPARLRIEEVREA